LCVDNESHIIDLVNALAPKQNWRNGRDLELSSLKFLLECLTTRLRVKRDRWIPWEKGETKLELLSRMRRES